VSRHQSLVHLLWARLPNCSLPEIGRLSSLLDLDERNRFLAYTRNEDRWRFVLGRALLFFGIKTLFGNRRCDLKLTSFGRPYLEFQGHSKFDFNISHSGQLVVCAFVQEGRVGVDVADLNEFGEYNDLLDSVLTPQEKTRLELNSCSQKQKCFARYWTVKEAILKFSGVGLHIEPPQINVDFSNPRYPKIVECPSLVSEKPKDLFVESWCFQKDMMIALVWQKLSNYKNSDYQELEPRIQFIPTESLLNIRRFSNR